MFFRHTFWNTIVVVGSDYSYIYSATLKEDLVLTEDLVVAHEVGHQFGLGHGNSFISPIDPTCILVGIPECGGISTCPAANMGLMANAAITSTTSFLIHRYQNLIRSRIESPGH